MFKKQKKGLNSGLKIDILYFEDVIVKTSLFVSEKKINIIIQIFFTQHLYINNI